MKTAIAILTIALAAQGASMANAKDHSWGKEQIPTPIFVKAKDGHCPPGLAKKAVPCVPPGHAKRYGIGEYIRDGYIRIDDPSRWGLRRYGYYVRAGDYVYEVNRETHQVLNLIGAIADILN